MRGWAAVAGLAGLAAAVTAVLMWWRWRQFSASWRVEVGAGRHRLGEPMTWALLLSGLGLVFNAGGLAVRNPTGDGHVFGMLGAVLGAVVLIGAIGGLLAERRWNRR